MVFKEITKENFWDCIELSVAKEQVDFVTSNAVSIAQSKVQQECIPLAVYVNEIMVGFVMYCIDEDDGELQRRILMQFRKAAEEDVSSIMDIIGQAQEYLREQGIDQWQDNYPNSETIKNDINNNDGYVLLKDNIIVGTVAAVFGREKSYKKIYDGKWLSDDKYAAIHRIAVSSKFKGLGLASIILENIEEICLSRGIRDIKIDTHEENLSMQKLLKKNGFQYCGIIYLEDNSKRIALEKIL